MKLLRTLCLLSGLLLVSCNNAELTESLQEQTRDITFSLNTFSNTQEPMSTPQCAPSTRANEFTATPTRLLVLDVAGGTVKQTIERTENILDALSLTLTYGTHDIYLLAAVNPYASYSTTDISVLWNATNRPSYTWAKKIQVTVSQTSAATESVTLPLVIGRIDLICNDVQDPAATKMQISGKMCWTLDLTTMNGIAPTTPWSYTIDIPNTTAGKTFATYSFAPSSGDLSYLTFTALNSSDQEITSHTLTDVPVTAGYITKYTGLFYSNTQGFTLSVANSWTDVNEQTY